MRYSTGNPVEPNGSSDPRDLYDNSANLDLMVNGEEEAYQDRTGQSRKSWSGMEMEFSHEQTERQSAFEASQAAQQSEFNEFLLSSGYELIGDYDADGPLTVTRVNQVFSKNGEFWRAGPSLALPYTTVDDWAVDEVKFVSVGDATLRQQLASPEGSGMVGHEGSTVKGAINDLEDSLNDLEGAFDAQAGVIEVFRGRPLFLLAAGQSNMALSQLEYGTSSLQSWTPPANLKIWNNPNFTDGSGDTSSTATGTAFITPPSNRLTCGMAWAAEIARANPTRSVYLVQASYSGQSITHWSDPATAAPNMFDVTDANVTAAAAVLAPMGVTVLDEMLWWQGESDSGTSNYPLLFQTFINRVAVKTWWHRDIPINVCAISKTAISGIASNDAFNSTLRRMCAQDPNFRRYFDTGWLDASYWDAYQHAREGYTNLMRALVCIKEGAPARPIQGIWTPRLLLNSVDTGAVYTRQAGWWSRVDDTVSLGFDIATTTKSSGVGIVTVGGIPDFLVAAAETEFGGGAQQFAGSLILHNVVSPVSLPILQLNDGEIFLRLMKTTQSSGNDVKSIMQSTDITNTTQITGQITYRSVPMQRGP